MKQTFLKKTHFQKKTTVIKSGLCIPACYIWNGVERIPSWENLNKSESKYISTEIALYLEFQDNSGDEIGTDR